jgi:hypothetical protein
MMTQQPLPPPHYHTDQHPYGDILVGALALTIGAAVLRRTFDFHDKL